MRSGHINPARCSFKGEGCGGRDETTADTASTENTDGGRNYGEIREDDPRRNATDAICACSSTNTPFSPKSDRREERIQEKE